jgi:hypothetical protein
VLPLKHNNKFTQVIIESKKMKTKSIKIIAASMLILALSACTTPTQPTIDSASLGTIVAQDVQLTQAAATLTSVIAQESATPLATNTPILPTNTATPEPSVTPTPSGAWLTMNQNTNCRQGPATFWPIIMTLNQGTSVEGIARSTVNDFVYVRVIDTSVHYCWVYSPATTYTYDLSRLAQYTPVPTTTPTITPTSAAGFSLSYDSLATCSSDYSLRLLVKNTGYLTWQSIKIVIVDSAAGVTLISSADNFTGYDGCTVAQTQGDLTTGESGLVSNFDSAPFTYNPKGHPLVVTVSLYSEKGQSGTVISKSLSVTP